MVARLKGPKPGCLAIKGGRIWNKLTCGQTVATVHNSLADNFCITSSIRNCCFDDDSVPKDPGTSPGQECRSALRGSIRALLTGGRHWNLIVLYFWSHASITLYVFSDFESVGGASLWP